MRVMSPKMNRSYFLFLALTAFSPTLFALPFGDAFPTHSTTVANCPHYLNSVQPSPELIQALSSSPPLLTASESTPRQLRVGDIISSPSFAEATLYGPQEFHQGRALARYLIIKKLPSSAQPDPVVAIGFGHVYRPGDEYWNEFTAIRIDNTESGLKIHEPEERVFFSTLWLRHYDNEAEDIQWYGYLGPAE